MASLAYATTGSGPSAGGIGWINFGPTFSLTPGQTVTGVSATLLDGSTITFDINSTRNSGDIKTLFARIAPYSGLSAFGQPPPIGGYSGLATSYVSLMLEAGTFDYTINISNISVVDSNSNPVPNYTIIVADAETTSGAPYNESSIYNTNGGVWGLLTTLGDTSNPQISGIGTQTFTASNATTVPTGSNVVTTQSPTTVTTQLIASAGGYMGIVVGVAITKVSIEKRIINRLSASDQFNLAITGTPSNTSTTTGSLVGIQSVSSDVFGLAGNSYTINESMAPGSSSALSGYTTCVSWSNLAAGGTVGPNPAALGDSVTLALGDVMTATVTNTPNNILNDYSTSYGCKDDTIVYTVNIPNPGNATYSGVTFKATIPNGTSLVPGTFKQDSTVIVGSPADPGVTLPNSIPAGTTSVITFSVKVDATTSLSSPNYATVQFPNGCPVDSNTLVLSLNSSRCRGVKFI